MTVDVIIRLMYKSIESRLTTLVFIFSLVFLVPGSDWKGFRYRRWTLSNSCMSSCWVSLGLRRWRLRVFSTRGGRRSRLSAAARPSRSHSWCVLYSRSVLLVSLVSKFEPRSPFDGSQARSELVVLLNGVAQNCARKCLESFTIMPNLMPRI